MAEEKLHPARWCVPLARPVLVRGGPKLIMLADVRLFILDWLPPESQTAPIWRRVCEDLLAAARSGSPDALTISLETALLIDGRLDEPRMIA
ncbi:MAG TPA: hypothetical protein VIY51_00995 [Xanthobacteraceae bacterium]